MARRGAADAVSPGGGASWYQGGFIDHYVTATIYPEGLTRSAQLVLGIAVLVINGTVYTIWWHRRRARRQA